MAKETILLYLSRHCNKIIYLKHWILISLLISLGERPVYGSIAGYGYEKLKKFIIQHNVGIDLKYTRRGEAWTKKSDFEYRDNLHCFHKKIQIVYIYKSYIEKNWMTVSLQRKFTTNLYPETMSFGRSKFILVCH